VARIGILGGTFNPPHLGHLICAQAAQTALGLDAVVFVPVGQPPHKQITGDPGHELRFELCCRATESNDRFEVSRAEIDRPGKSYTVDTLNALHLEHPEDQLTFIVGADMAASLSSWREPERLLSVASFAVGQRAGHGATAEKIAAAVAEIPGASERMEFFKMGRIDISSSEIRDRVARGLPIRYLVPDGVCDLISEKGLYREGITR